MFLTSLVILFLLPLFLFTIIHLSTAHIIFTSTSHRRRETYEHAYECSILCLPYHRLF